MLAFKTKMLPFLILKVKNNYIELWGYVSGVYGDVLV